MRANTKERGVFPLVLGVVLWMAGSANDMNWVVLLGVLAVIVGIWHLEDAA